MVLFLFTAIFLDGSVYLSPKQRLNLTCNATGSSRAPEFIDWFHNGNLIDERRDNWRNRAEIFNYKPEVPGRSLISQLTIEHVEPKDAGVYVCRSMTPSVNSGVDTTSITVHILNGMYNYRIIIYHVINIILQIEIFPNLLFFLYINIITKIKIENGNAEWPIGLQNSEKKTSCTLHVTQCLQSIYMNCMICVITYL